MEWETVSNDQIDQMIDHFSGLSTAAMARVCALIHEVDTRQSWMSDGARNLTDWVCSRLKVRHSFATQIVAVTRRLADLPALAERFAAGDLSLDQVDAISRMATAETEEDLIEQAMGLTNAALDRQARRSRGKSLEADEDVHRRRRLYRQWKLDESELRFGGQLPAEAGRILDEAIDSRIAEMGTHPETGLFDPFEARAADALAELAAGDQVEGHITVFADIDSLVDGSGGTVELDNTALVPGELARRLGCDGAIRTIMTEGAQPVGIGRKSRRIPVWLRDLVHYRDGGQCQFPGCRSTRWLQIHHVQHWADRGTTDLDNLIVLCGFHHRFLHEKRWHITERDGQWQFRKPDWKLFPHSKPPLPPRLRELVRSP